MHRLIWICLLSLNLQANYSIPTDWIKAKHSQIKINDFTYPLVRLKNSGRPVLLIHGFLGNAHNYKEIGTYLSRAGLDVWSVTWTKNQKLDLNEAGILFLKTIIDKIHRKTNKKVIIVGHSLGGVISKIYLSGAYFKKDSTIGFSETRKKRIAKKVHSFYSLNSPNAFQYFFKNLESFVKAFPSFKLPFSKDLSDVINSNLLKKDLRKVKLWQKSLWLTKSKHFLSLFHNFFHLDVNNASSVIAHFLRYDYQRISRVILNQIECSVKWDQITDCYKKVNYSREFLNLNSMIPKYYLASSEDIIAPFESVELEADANQSRFILLNDSGHADLFVGNDALKVSRYIINTIK